MSSAIQRSSEFQILPDLGVSLLSQGRCESQLREGVEVESLAPRVIGKSKEAEHDRIA